MLLSFMSTKNGYTLTYDPYGRQFYSGWVSTQALWNTPQMIQLIGQKADHVSLFYRRI